MASESDESTSDRQDLTDSDEPDPCWSVWSAQPVVYSPPNLASCL